MAIILFMAAAAAAAPPRPTIAPGSGLISSVQACQQIKDDPARLACFDRSVAALASANARGDVAVVDRQQMREARRTLFGFAVPRLPFFTGSKDVQEEPKRLVSTVASFRGIGNGFFRVTIADPESTWESTETVMSVSGVLWKLTVSPTYGSSEQAAVLSTVTCLSLASTW